MGKYINYASLKKSLTDAVSVAASVTTAAVGKAAEVAKDIAVDLGGARCLKDYKLTGHVATGGPSSCWKVYSAVSKKPGAIYSEVCIWMLDKKGLLDSASRNGKARAVEPLLEQQRRACGQLARLKHPGILRIVEPLEENNAQMVFVSEPLQGSLHNILTHFKDVPTATPDQQAITLSTLEVKYGLVHLSETLHFLHTEAGLAHCSLSPEAIFISQDGGWRLGGLAHCRPSDYAMPTGQFVERFHYDNNYPHIWETMLRPPLAYVAPELVEGFQSQANTPISPACDMFSLAAVTYELLAGRQLLDVGQSLAEYKIKLGQLSHADLSKLSPLLQGVLQAMVAVNPAARPTAAAFSSSQFFQEDVLLRALRFLDTLLQRESMQKAAFLKDLGEFWTQFDDRLLNSRVLPPLLQELRNESIQLSVLPVVMKIIEKQTKVEFVQNTLPQLKPILDTASGELLLAFIRHTSILYQLMTQEAANDVLLPLLLRACDSKDVKVQEEVLKNLRKMSGDISYQLLKESLVPRALSLVQRTTSAVVRCHALMLLGSVVYRLDREDAEKMLEVMGQVTKVDRTANTVMCAMSVTDAVSKHYGHEVTASQCLPLLSPLLLAPSLNAKHFNQLIGIIRGMIDRVQEKRSPELNALTADLSATSGRGQGEVSWDVPIGSFQSSPSTVSLSSITSSPTAKQTPASSNTMASWAAPSTMAFSTRPSQSPMDWSQGVLIGPTSASPSVAPLQGSKPPEPLTWTPMGATMNGGLPKPISSVGADSGSTNPSNGVGGVDDMFGGLAVTRLSSDGIGTTPHSGSHDWSMKPPSHASGLHTSQLAGSTTSPPPVRGPPMRGSTGGTTTSGTTWRPAASLASMGQPSTHSTTGPGPVRPSPDTTGSSGTLNLGASTGPDLFAGLAAAAGSRGLGGGVPPLSGDPFNFLVAPPGGVSRPAQPSDPFALPVATSSSPAWTPMNPPPPAPSITSMSHNNDPFASLTSAPRGPSGSVQNQSGLNQVVDEWSGFTGSLL